jgi:YD repeat-containing protein
LAILLLWIGSMPAQSVQPVAQADPLLLVSSPIQIERASQPADRPTGELTDRAGESPSPQIGRAANASRTIVYTYDAAGRLAQAHYGGKVIDYTYDSAGNLTGKTFKVYVYLPLVLKGQ